MLDAHGIQMKTPPQTNVSGCLASPFVAMPVFPLSPIIGLEISSRWSNDLFNAALAGDDVMRTLFGMSRATGNFMQYTYDADDAENRLRNSRLLRPLQAHYRPLIMRQRCSIDPLTVWRNLSSHE